VTTILTYTFVYGLCQFRGSTGVPIIIIEVLSGFTRSLHVDGGIVHIIRALPRSSSFFPVQYLCSSKNSALYKR
jgi:hypothetical protein